jgi:hypothetical protein
MRQLTTGEPVWDLQFDENGQLTTPAQGDVLTEVAARASPTYSSSATGGARRKIARERCMTKCSR